MPYGLWLKAQRNLCHRQFCILPWHRDGCGFPTTKGFCLMKQWKLTEENVSVAVEAVLCANTTLLPREVLNAGWHRAASPVSKFRISSHPTPEIINSGSCSQPLPLICGVCSAFLSTVTQKLTVLCPLVFLQQTFLHRTSCFSWVQIFLHTHDLPQT